MIVSSYYNKNNNVILMTTTKKHDRVKTEGGITTLFAGSEVVGVNVFESDLGIEAGLVNSKSMPDEIVNLFSGNIENPFEVGYIESIEKHPKSEKLNVCQVRLNSGVTQIVCGASNVEQGIKVIVAKIGAVMPSGMKIIPSKLIDIPSNGMICSLRELGREQQSPGIEILGEDFNIGEDYL